MDRNEVIEGLKNKLFYFLKERYELVDTTTISNDAMNDSKDLLELILKALDKAVEGERSRINKNVSEKLLELSEKDCGFCNYGDLIKEYIEEIKKIINYGKE